MYFMAVVQFHGCHLTITNDCMSKVTTSTAPAKSKFSHNLILEKEHSEKLIIQ